jgi:hypothetical protein
MAAPQEVEIEADLDEPEVLLEPDDDFPAPASPGGAPRQAAAGDDAGISIDVVPVDDTMSSTTPPPSPPPGQQGVGDAISSIRQTLEATGDIKPQAARQAAQKSEAAETFMVPSSSLEEAVPMTADSLGDLDSLDDAPDLETDDDSLDLSESLDLDGDLGDLDDDE